MTHQQPNATQWLDAALFEGEIHPDEDLTAAVTFTTKFGSHRRKFAQVQTIIVEQGGFDELVRAKGLFASMAARQGIFPPK